MNFTLERISQPDIEPLTLDDIRRHVRSIDGVNQDDGDLVDLVTAGREWVEDYTGRALVDQKWRLTIDSRFSNRSIAGDTVSGVAGPIVSPGYGLGRYEWIGPWYRREINLHKAPVIAITSFVSVDDAGVETPIDPTTYQLREANSKWPRVVPLNGAIWPSGSFTGGLRIEFRAGFVNRIDAPIQDESVIPVRFKQAIKLWAEANYDRDEKMMPILLDTAERLIKSERRDLQLT